MAPRRQRLAQRRKAVGFTQEVFAEQLDVERSTVVRWEAGDTEPSPWRRPKIGGDRQLNAHILGSMSHLTHHCGQPQKAMQLARRGHKALHGGPPQPQLQARLLTMHARGSAALGHREDCTRMLIQAEKTLDAAPAEQPSPWVSHFDEASLASETARCMRHLGDLSQAQRQAERIIELRPDTGTRSRAFGQLLLVTVLIAQGKPEQACAIAHDVLTATQSLGFLPGDPPGHSAGLVEGP